MGNASGRVEGLKEGIEQGLEKGIEIGEAKGREEGIMQTAKTVLKQGIPAEKWGVNVSLVRRYCTQERIPGVIQRDGAWLIPEDAKRPVKIEPSAKESVVLPALAQKLLRQKKKKSFHGLYDYVQINLTYSSCRIVNTLLQTPFLLRSRSQQYRRKE